MSDIFDHAQDAMDSLYDGQVDQEGLSFSGYPYKDKWKPSPFVQIRGKIVHSTKKAFLIRDVKIQTWIPRSQTKHIGSTICIPKWLKDNLIWVGM